MENRITVPKKAYIPVKNNGRYGITVNPILLAKAVEELMKVVPAEVFETIEIEINPYDTDREYRRSDVSPLYTAKQVCVQLTRDFTTEEKEAAREIELAQLKFKGLTTEIPSIHSVPTSESKQKASFFNPASWTGRGN